MRYQFLFNNLVNPPRFPWRPAPATARAPSDSDETVTEALLAPETEEERREALDETAALPADLGQSGFDVVPRERSRSRSRS